MQKQTNAPCLKSAKIKRALIMLTTLFLTASAICQQRFLWPDNKKCAIVLTYDDGLSSQLQTAIPQLDSARLNGTFFLTGNLTEKTIVQWRNAARNGHELGNHSLYHPCPASLYEQHPHFVSDSYDRYSIIREIGVMNTVLHLIDQKSTRTYAYPCSETSVNGMDYADTLQTTRLVKYARIGGDASSVITEFKKLDGLKVPSWGISNKPNGRQLIDFVKQVQLAGGLGVLMFHGVGGDYIDVSAAAHRDLIRYLQQHTDIWVGTFQEVMDYITAANKN
ncbi:MAG TPA: polysaccharide deacetylase family protein [Niastella sp.]|nr:polysaccharide deacetylase family protein [Niastella sp.]